MVCVILATLFIAAAAVRLYNINTAKIYFYPTRQYYSFCIARHFYFEGIESIPDWERRIAAINKEALDDKEPPITEYLVSLIWRAAGGQNHWAPSLLSSAFWLIGGIFVFLTAKKYSPPLAAAIATAFYLLAPFAILISRSFQPEPLMTMMFAAGIYTIFNYYENQSSKRLLIMAVVSGLAILVKVSIIFPIWAAFIAPGIRKNGLRKTIFSPSHLVFIALGIVPAFVYYSYLAICTEEVRMVAESIFAPQLLWDSFFWIGWLNQIASVVGFIPLLVAGFGILLVRDKTVRSIFVALTIGYLVYSIVFAYTTATHDYYQVQAVPIVALALAPAIAFFLNHLRHKNAPLHRPAIIIGLLMLAALLALLATIKTSAFRTENKYIKSPLAFAYKCFGLRPDYLSQFSADYSNFIQRAENIGRAVNHSDKTITLALTVPLWYYGQYAGHRWPRHSHWSTHQDHAGVGTGAKWKQYQGLTAEELFEKHFSGFSPQYFVVFLEYFEKQKSLQEFLYGKFKVLIREENYLIFDLTKPKQ
jgi:4-amino-4-deoxy-L-arabinose transferase-like glycosyltransferase